MQKYKSAVEKHRQLIIDAQNYIWANPETGYREVKTSKYMEDAFEKLGYEITRADGIPGFYTVIDTGREGPEVLILGELDSLICPEHPDADPETGAVHCCGHSAQAAALLGIAAALKEPHILDDLSGRIRLCAVPAEELIEIEYRAELKKSGKVRYFGGKTEFLYRGYFDGVDIAFMVHTQSGKTFSISKGSIGCMTKKITYKGVSAHAGGSPWNGINALYAANLGLNAINSLRETFREKDLIRVHPIIKNGGAAVNAIPDNVVIESYVRGANFEAIREANLKVNRALIGAALSLGANVDINDAPGYAPLVNSADMIDVAKEAGDLMGEYNCEIEDRIGTGCTDMGDLTQLMPAVHPYAPGATGKSHGSDYYIADPELACVQCARWQLNMLHLLLCDGAKRAKEIIENFTPTFKTKKEYFEMIDSFYCEGDRIEYNEDSAKITL